MLEPKYFVLTQQQYDWLLSKYPECKEYYCGMKIIVQKDIGKEDE